MKFTAEQLASARNLPRMFTQNVLAAATSTTVSEWRRLMDTPGGPEYETTVGGATIYRRNQVLHFMHRNIKNPEKRV